MRFFVEKVDNGNSLEEGPRYTWSVSDRENVRDGYPVSVADRDKREQARALAREMNVADAVVKGIVSFLRGAAGVS